VEVQVRPWRRVFVLSSNTINQTPCAPKRHSQRLYSARTPLTRGTSKYPTTLSHLLPFYRTKPTPTEAESQAKRSKSSGTSAHGGHGRGRSLLAGAPVPPSRVTGGIRDAAAEDAVQVASAVPAAGARGLLAPGAAPAVPAPLLAPPPVQDAGRGAGRQPGDGGRDADAAEAEAARGRGTARRARVGVSTERAPGEAEAGEGRRG
jgi:hypothetical protein